MSESTIDAADGTKIVFRVVGSGPALVLTNGLTTTSFFWKYLRPLWAERYTVVTWEFPGHAQSEPARSAACATIEGQAAILARITDAAAIERAVHVGFSVGAQVVFEFAQRAPERCLGLVNLLGSFEHGLSSTSLPLPGAVLHALLNSRGAEWVARLVQRTAALATLPPGLATARRLHIVGAEISAEDLRQLIADLARVDPRTCAALACSAEAHSARPFLARCELPLLIVTGSLDRFAPPRSVGEVLRRLVPHSELATLEGATHTALLDHAPAVARAVERFLSAHAR